MSNGKEAEGTDLFFGSNYLPGSFDKVYMEIFYLDQFVK